MAGIWSKFLVAQNPIPLLSTRLPRLPQCGSFSLRIIFLIIMNSPTYFIVFSPVVFGSFITLNRVWNVFYNILILSKLGPYRSLKSNKIECRLWMPQSVTQMPIKLQACLKEVSFSVSYLKSPTHAFHNMDWLASTEHVTWPDLIMKASSTNLNLNFFHFLLKDF